MEYNFKEIEQEARSKWDFKVKNPDYFVLSMWPYPSGKLHMGHLRNYLIGDVIARFKTMQGFRVLHPMGWDAFGLPAENAAIERGVHPRTWTLENIRQMKEGLSTLGFSFDWSREETSCLPEYYKHEQKMFIDFYKEGIAYKKEAVVNWDPVEASVLANEQVVDGRGWRSGALVEKKLLSQWFLRISDFAPQLLEDLKLLEKWPEKVKTMQENWIGRSEGCEIDFDIENSVERIRIFTTRPETLFGASFVAISYAHPLAGAIKKADDFIKECEAGSTKAEDIETAEKKGFFTGLYAINPINKERLPIYIANFVLMDYGTGALLGCPAHDQRDYEFAVKYHLPIKQVVAESEFHKGLHGEKILPMNDSGFENTTPIISGRGVMVKSSSDIINLDGLTTEEAREKMFEKYGKKVNYRLKDWGVSRQRYWGCPIPIINCKTCGSVPVPEADLPVTLPEDIEITVGENPLKKHPTWRFVNCPSCNGAAERETDTLDTFFESSWYFLRFSGNGAFETAFKNPLPVNDYIGGIEHAILHLLYARFFTKALKKCGYPLNFTEPFERLITQGMVCHKTFETLDGKWLSPEEAASLAPNLYTVGSSIKMSKSKKNVVEPRVIVEKYGADTARFFIASDNPPERDMEWTEEGVAASHKFLSKLWNFGSSMQGVPVKEPLIEIQKKFHKILSEYLFSLETIAFNKSIAKIREACNIAFELPREEARFIFENIIPMLSPFIPHFAFKMGEILKVNPEKMLELKKDLLEEKEVCISIQINGKLRGTILAPKDSEKEVVKEMALMDISVSKHIKGEIKKEIFIKNKTINFVI